MADYPVRMNAASNARWIALSQGVRVGMQFVSVVVLARLLTPADFGLMAMIVVLSNLVALLRDLGTGAAIVQQKDLAPATSNAVFWLNVLLGAILAVIVGGGADLFAASFRAPNLVPMLLALAPSFLIGSLGSLPKALLERRSAFSIVARIEILSALVTVAVTVTSAAFGAGAMSWIYGILVGVSLSTLQLWQAAAWRPTFENSMPQLGSLLKFSGYLSGFNLINYFARNADAFIIGRYLGAGALGLYSSAYKIMLFPVQNLTWVASRALYPVLCRHQDDLPAMAALYFKSVAVILFFTAPLMAGVFVLREPFIDVLMGPSWRGVADLLLWLAPVGFVQSVVSTTGTVSAARGRTDLLFGIGAASAVLQVSSFVVGVRWGVTGVAACYLAANLLAAVPALLVALRQLEQPLAALLLVTLPSVACALAMAIAVEVGVQLARPLGLSAPTLLAGGALAGGSTYLILMAVIARPNVRMVLGLLGVLGRPAH